MSHLREALGGRRPHARGRGARRPQIRVLALEPEILLPSHGLPLQGNGEITRQLTRYRDAIRYVHDEVVKGMNAGKDVWTLMREIKLPKGLEIGDLKIGERLMLKMPAPSKEVQDSPYPPDLDRERTREERLEWFLSSIYCTCPVKGDRCTGMFYTLMACNPNACGTPSAMKKNIANKIDKGMTDRQIFEEMLKTYGPLLTRPHLLP